MIEMYDKLKDMLENEVDKIVKDGQVTQTTLCNLDTLIDVIKDIEEIKEKEDFGYSGRRGRGGMMYDDGYSRNGYENYNRGSSYDGRYDNRYYDDRGRDGYMKYEGDLHYSGTGSKDHMISLMKDAMSQATTQEEHDEIMKMIKKMENK